MIFFFSVVRVCYKNKSIKVLVKIYLLILAKIYDMYGVPKVCDNMEWIKDL